MNRPPMSKGELEVARAIWKLSEATVGEVHEAMEERTGMEYATVQTYIRRLEAKGYLSARRVGRTKVYRAKVKPTLVIREKVDDLLQVLFEGKAVPLVRHLLDEGNLSADDLQELKRLIEDLEDGDEQ